MRAVQPSPDTFMVDDHTEEKSSKMSWEVKVTERNWLRCSV